MRTLILAVVAVSLATYATRVHAQVGMVILEDPITEPGADTCQVRDTYALAGAGGGVHELRSLSPAGTWVTTGYFAVTTTQEVIGGLPAAVNDYEGTCDWRIERGLYFPLDGAPEEAMGMVVSEANLASEGGSLVLRTGTLIPDGLAVQCIASVQNAVGVGVVTPDEGEPQSALGSSCSCPACPLGGRFWIPFFVIGIGNVPGGIQCCQHACATACSNLHDSGDPASAWLIGQGAWVACMLCQ